MRFVLTKLFLILFVASLVNASTESSKREVRVKRQFDYGNDDVIETTTKRKIIS
jgi:hypothetical protein